LKIIFHTYEILLDMSSVFCIELKKKN